MIGHQNRTQAYAPAFETALLYTAPGQADWADPDTSFVCGDCVNFFRKTKGAAKGRCLEYSRLMRGKQGATLGAAQQACRRFARDPALSR
jgi:hypothetical protein